jgi:hypothetical protein
MSGANGQEEIIGGIVPNPPAAVAKPISVSETAWLDTAMFDQSYRVARAIAMSGLAPAGFAGQNFEETAARCFRLVMMAWTWKMNPWQLADSCYIGPGGKFCVEGKVAIGVIGCHPAVNGHLEFEHSGSGEDRTVTVSATLAGESKPREITGSVRQWAKEQWSSKKKAFVPPNPMWYAAGPGQDQKLCYVGAIWWCRRHCPEILLGVSIAEDVEGMVEPPIEALEPPRKALSGSHGETPAGTLEAAVDRLDAAGFNGLKEIHSVQDHLKISAGSITEADVSRMVAEVERRISAAKGGAA